MGCSPKTRKTTSGKGVVLDPSDVGGWPEPESAPAPADSDHDGMPDAGETGKGLNPNTAADGALDPDGDGYTNLEDYLNWLAAGNEALEDCPNRKRQYRFGLTRIRVEALTRNGGLM